MTERLEIIFSLIDRCGTFADIGCDHGYISQKVLERGLADKVYAADISAASLKKARDLIGDGYGTAFSCYVSDGFSALPHDIDTALIAGMGGEEICAIITAAEVLPETLILQPMKNADKVRRLLVGLGYGTDKDYTFFSAGKYYDIIRAAKSLPVRGYSETEYVYGKDNVIERGEGFIKFVKMKLAEAESAVGRINDSEKKREMLERIEILKDFLK